MGDEDALLHRLRLRGRIDDASPSEVDPLVATGLAVRGRRGIAITPAGRAEATRRARLSGGSGEEARARHAYDAFLPLNVELVQLCSEWQAEHDRSTVTRLGTLDDRAGALVRRLGGHVVRFAGYRSRLRDARHRIEAGENEWFTSPRCDSYHTVWMELHEDLLLALGIERADE